VRGSGGCARIFAPSWGRRPFRLPPRRGKEEQRSGSRHTYTHAHRRTTRRKSNTNCVRRRRVTMTTSKVPERKIIHIQAACYIYIYIYIYSYERIIICNVYAAALLTLADRRVNVLYQRCQRRRPKLEYIYLYNIVVFICIIAA